MSDPIHLSGVKLYYSTDGGTTWTDGSLTFRIHNWECRYRAENISTLTYAKGFRLLPYNIKRIALSFTVDVDELAAGGQPFAQNATALAKWRHLQGFDFAGLKRVDVGSTANLDGFTEFRTASFASYNLVNSGEFFDFSPDSQQSRTYLAQMITAEKV